MTDRTDGTGNGSARLSRSSGDCLAIFLIINIIPGELEIWLLVLEQAIVLRFEATTKLVRDLRCEASATQHNTEAARRQVLI